jgi:hypothetical protein
MKLSSAAYDGEWRGTYMKRPVGTEVSRPEGSVTVWCTLLDIVAMSLNGDRGRCVIGRRIVLGAPMIRRVNGSISERFIC